MKSSSLGKQAENVARQYLENQGLNLVNQNFRAPHGEIDLIMQAPDLTLIFIEVRLRKNSVFADAAHSITRQKQRRLIHATEYFLQTHPEYHNCNLRFDVVLFSHLEQTPDWIIAAFEATAS